MVDRTVCPTACATSTSRKPIRASPARQPQGHHEQANPRIFVLRSAVQGNTPPLLHLPEHTLESRMSHTAPSKFPKNPSGHPRQLPASVSPHSAGTTAPFSARRCTAPHRSLARLTALPYLVTRCSTPQAHPRSSNILHATAQCLTVLQPTAQSVCPGAAEVPQHGCRPSPVPPWWLHTGAWLALNAL